MQKETTLVFAGLTVKSDMFKNDFSFKIDKEEESEFSELLYIAIMRHKSLGLSNTLRDKNKEALMKRSQLVLNQWIESWNKENDSSPKIEDVKKIREIWETILSKSLDMDHALDLKKCKNNDPFESSNRYSELKSKLESLTIPALPKMGFLPTKPIYNEPAVSFFKKVQLKKRKIIQAYQIEYNKKLEAWQKIIERNENVHAKRIEEYDKLVASINIECEALKSDFENERENYEDQRLKMNEAIDSLEINYKLKESNAVEKYFNLVMNKSELPDMFPKNTVFEYIQETETLYISAELPHPDLIPREKINRLNNENNIEAITEYSTKEFSQLYNDIIYKTIIKTLFEIFYSDKADTVGAIEYNGWVRVLNRGNGRYENVCITSLFTSRVAFEEINLHNIDPELCFKYLQGRSSADLTTLQSVDKPTTLPQKIDAVREVNKILEPLNKSNNLANMNWQEFEFKITELLRKEFSTETSEFKLLNSSLESGIEAINIDNDKYKFGKTIYYIKRSIKPISVVPVRELFGQIIHEGGTKGILITTADFTPEAYEFAKNKPISLINGISLLSLFENHGQKLRINLREAISLETWLS